MCVCVCVCVEMLDFCIFDKMIKISGKVGESNIYSGFTSKHVLSDLPTLPLILNIYIYIYKSKYILDKNSDRGLIFFASICTIYRAIASFGDFDNIRICIILLP